MNIGKFVLNVVVAFIAYGVLYTVGGDVIFRDAFATMAPAMHPQEETFVQTMGYHFVQTIVVVWMFGKAVGSGDMKAGVMFGVMFGLYLMATDAIWFANMLNLSGEARLPLTILHLVNGAIIGMLLAFMEGRGWGASSAAADSAEPEEG